MAEKTKDLKIGNKYTLGRKLGSGAFGEVYQGIKARANA